jgi:two-component system, sensor histidine kinase
VDSYEGWGCRVIAASSDAAALTRLAEYDHSPDLIISDYRLSDDRTGIEAITRLREALNVPVPALIISGDTDPLRLREVRANGYHVLNKPVSPRALRALLSHFFKKHDVADRSI